MPSSAKAVPALAAGFTSGLALLVAQVAYGTLIFSGPLAPHASQGVGLILFGNFAACLHHRAHGGLSRGNSGTVSRARHRDGTGRGHDGRGRRCPVRHHGGGADDRRRRRRRVLPRDRAIQARQPGALRALLGRGRFRGRDRRSRVSGRHDADGGGDDLARASRARAAAGTLEMEPRPGVRHRAVPGDETVGPSAHPPGRRRVRRDRISSRPRPPRHLRRRGEGRRVCC